MSDTHEANTNEENICIEKEVRISSMKERFKKIWSLNIIQRLLYLLSSIWVYAPVVGTILFWMGAWSAPIAFSSWWLFYFLTGNVGWFNKWLILNQVGFTPGIIALLIVEVIIFAFGLVLFLWGVIQIATVKIKKEGLVTRGLYKYIRHPQLLGLIIMAFSFTLYIPGTEDKGIKVGEIISWSFFSLILFLWSDFEERKLAKKFGEEFVQYRSRTGSFLPRVFNKTKKRKHFYVIKYWKRYLFTFLGYSGFYLIMYLLTYILSLSRFGILTWG